MDHQINYSKDKTNQQQAKTFTEIEIKVPWGHIAGKWWGPQEKRPILALHGWQDNAGTFDTLIPLLPSDLSILAIDLPGHGLSSHIPDGFIYHQVDYIYVICMIMKEYNWDKISIIGHSMGAILGFLMAGIFPENVDMLIALDSHRPINYLETNYGPIMSHIIRSWLIADERNRNGEEPPSYTYDECIEKLYIGTRSSIDRDKCSYILNRNIRKSTKYPDRYYFARDNRLKHAHTSVWPQKMYAKLLASGVCPTLYIRALGSPIYDNKIFEANMKVMKKNPDFEYHTVEGRHHVHLNNPQEMSEIINKFIWKHKFLSKSKL